MMQKDVTYYYKFRKWCWGCGRRRGQVSQGKRHKKSAAVLLERDQPSATWSSRVTSDVRFDLQLQEQEWCGRAGGVASGERPLLNAQDDTVSYYRMRPSSDSARGLQKTDVSREQNEKNASILLMYGNRHKSRPTKHYSRLSNACGFWGTFFFCPPFYFWKSAGSSFCCSKLARCFYFCEAAVHYLMVVAALMTMFSAGRRVDWEDFTKTKRFSYWACGTNWSALVKTVHLVHWQTCASALPLQL